MVAALVAMTAALFPAAGHATPSAGCNSESCRAFPQFNALNRTIDEVLYPGDPVRPAIVALTMRAQAAYPGDRFYPGDPVKPFQKALRRSYHALGELGDFVLDHTGEGGGARLNDAQTGRLLAAIGGVEAANVWTIPPPST